MLAVATFIALGIGCLVAAVVVLREASKMVASPSPPTFSMDEAYAWVVENLPDIVAATLTPDDVRRILTLQIEYFESRGVARNGSSKNVVTGDHVVSAAETVDYIIERCAATGEEYIPEQIHPVIEVQLDYLRAIGAIGPAIDQAPDE